MIARSCIVILGLFAVACGGEQEGPLPEGDPAAGQLQQSIPPVDTTRTPQTPSTTFVDTTIAPAVAGEDGWSYALRTEADLDGDGVEERAVLTARVELYQGRPAWDDGQPWQAYVEDSDGRRTYLYSRYVQLGTVTMRVGLPEEGRSSSVILLEHLPDRLSLYELEYLGPDSVDGFVRFERAVDPRGETASPTLP